MLIPSWFAKDGYEEEEGDLNLKLSRAVGHACHKRWNQLHIFLHTGGACDGWKFFNYAKPFRLFSPVKIVLCKTKLNRFKNIKNYIFIIVCILCTLFKNALTRRRSGFEQVIILCKINSFSILKFRLGSAGDSFRASAHHHYYSPVNSWKINFFCFIHNSSETSIDQSLPFQWDQIWRNIAILAKMFKSLAIFKGLLIIW